VEHILFIFFDVYLIHAISLSKKTFCSLLKMTLFLQKLTKKQKASLFSEAFEYYKSVATIDQND